MSSFNLLSLGTQAVRANQTALGVVGQNISNVNTEGYSRQVVHFASTIPSGVEIADVERVTNSFLTKQFWTDNSNFERADIYADLALEADKLLGQEITNITGAMDSYFGAMQNAVNDPTSMAHRELLIAQSNTLTDRFNSLYANLNQQHEKINARIDDSVSSINLYADSVAEYNNQIRLANARGDSVNELLDKRDAAIEKISGHADIQVIENSDGLVDIRLANGQPLVVGLDANKLYTFSQEYQGTERKIGIDISGTQTDITDQISGGTIGGVLGYRDEILNPSLNELGRIAISFSMSMNEVQQSGMDLNNELGDRLMTDPNTSRAMSQRISGYTENRGNYNIADVRITDLSQLTADEFELELTGAKEFRLTNLTTGEVLTQDNLRQVVSSGDVSDGGYYMDDATGQLRLEVGGIEVQIDSTRSFTVNDKFLIQPTRQGAEQIDTEITDPRKFALASPVRANTDPENTGTGELKVQVKDIGHSTFTQKAGELSPPVEIVFSGTSPNLTYTAYDMTDPANPVPLDVGNGPISAQPYVAGEVIDLGGYEATIVNEPKAGDNFSFAYNTDGFSDNRNALAMSNLQQADLLDSGSYQDSYSALLERVAGKTAGAKIVVQSSEAVLSSTKDARASVSGVNMDEEAARLVQFQQAYQASAQIISASQKLFDTILNI